MNPALSSPTKMVIMSFRKPDFSDEPDSYIVQINPEKYTQTYKIAYDEDGAPGSMNAALKFNKMPPAEMKFELVFDATGALGDKRTDLDQEIAAFRKVVYNFDGEIHEPRYLQLSWGKLTFGARLNSLTLNYTMFTSGGAPLRARADVSFTNYEDPATIVKKEDKQSPDLTRTVVTQAGDTLPALSYRYYGDPAHYVDLARANGLVDFRRLRPGVSLVLPPLA